MRAALRVAAAARDRPVAQEGAYGPRLVERESASPSLKWGNAGRLDLRHPCAEATTKGLQLTCPQAWTETELASTQRVSDGYDIHYRLWGARTGSDVLVVLRGGMRQSAWQRPSRSPSAHVPRYPFSPLPDAAAVSMARAEIW